MSTCNEIVIYNKNTFEVHSRECTEGMSEVHVMKRLDEIHRTLNWATCDVIHICPENKPNMRSYDAFTIAMQKLTTTPTVGISRTVAEIVQSNYPNYPIAMPSPHKSIIIPCAYGVCAKITWLPQKSPSGLRLYSLIVAAADRM